MLGAPCTFPLTRNVVVPLMATLNLPRFTLGLLVWFFSTRTVLNAPDASQAITLYQGNQNNFSLSRIETSTPSTSCGETYDTSNMQSKRSKRRNNRKKS